MPHQIGHWIDGDVVHTSNHMSVVNPATEETVGQLSLSDGNILDKALSSSVQAFEAWRTVPPVKRAQILFKFKHLLEARNDELAEIVTREHGKTKDDANGSIARALEVIDYCCGIPKLLQGDYAHQVGSGIDNVTRREPLGVCLGITPFNFPVMIPVWQMVPAIACGNSFILKPSEQDPSSCNFLAELLQEAGLPKGVLNVLHGDKELVDDLLNDKRIQAVSMVGSTTVASAIYQKAIQNHKRAQTFGGAKNHCVVMNDVDIQSTASQIVGAAFGSAGQRCMAISVVVMVGNDIADKFVELIQEKAGLLQVGPGHDANTEVGPLINQRQKEKILGLINSGEDEGATLLLDGRGHPKVSEKGFFVGPTLFDHVKPTMRIYQEEIFGPVLCVVRADTLKAAVELVNSHTYGNGGAIMTNDGRAAQYFSEHVQVGMVGINVPIPVPSAYHSFGGWKQSSFGDVGMHGDQSIQFYTRRKSIAVRWALPKGAELAMTSHQS